MTLPRDWPDWLRRAIGEHLRQLRFEAKLSQAQLATALDSHREVVARVERGHHLPTLDVLWRYARALGADPLVLAANVDRVHYWYARTCDARKKAKERFR